jgi:hypothetical protein
MPAKVPEAPSAISRGMMKRRFQQRAANVVEKEKNKQSGGQAEKEK